MTAGKEPPLQRDSVSNGVG